MLKINRETQSFETLNSPSLAELSITERYDLQEFIANSPKDFFSELGLELFLVGKEVLPSTCVQDRIDLLALDREGQTVVIELKRGNHKLHMLQAVSYAGMISHWQPNDFFNAIDKTEEDALTDFLEVDRDDINRKQRIILIAEGFDYALLTAAEWLSEQHGVDITCCRIALAKDPATDSEYLVCSNVYPAPELAQESVARGRRKNSSDKAPWQDWESALETVGNPSVKSHFERELRNNRESYLLKRILRYRINGKRRLSIVARSKNAYVWQDGRFADDIRFWQDGISNPVSVKPVKNEQCLSFSLETVEDFHYFEKAAGQGLVSISWFDER